jgi:hypothetical protein
MRECDCRPGRCVCGFPRQAVDREFEQASARFAAMWAPTVNPRLGSSLDTFLLERRLLDEVNLRARVWLPADEFLEDE